MAIVRYTSEELDKMTDLTDWEKLRNMTDEDIDYSDIPEWTAEDFARATRGGVPLEHPQRVSVYVRPSLLARYQNTGKGWRKRLSENFETWLCQTQGIAAL
ncbi:MAG: BrnA antitoxin family protein [Bacteroidetes bacterium]|nr:BrnA antitoxin family protein [Bacteroidota bacterium]